MRLAIQVFRLFCLSFLVTVWGNASDTTPYLSLTGYLGKEEMMAARQQLDSATSLPIQQLAIEINSVSGDLNAVLDFATHLYQLKQQKRFPVAVYIHENATGPAAILPFLADDLEAGPYVSWGAIPFGSEGSLPNNILVNRVLSLLPLRTSHEALLQLLVVAMIDPDIVVIDKEGRWEIVRGQLDPTAQVIDAKDQTMVVNFRQLEQQGLLKKPIAVDQFRERYQTKKRGEPPVQAISEDQTSTLQERLAKHIIYNPNGPNSVGHILIDDRKSGITSATWLYVHAALEHYKKTKPIFVILELNTPGGEVYSAQLISDALKEMDTQNDIPVVTFINNWAISAGAMLAYSTRFIAVAKDGAMGAAEPVLLGSGGQMTEASEKVNSALRADFANRANFFGRNGLLAEGMVDKDPILVMRHGKIVKLNADSEIQMQGPNRDSIIKAKGKLLTLDADKLMEYGVADILLPPTKLEPITDEERTANRWPASKMALFKQPFFDKIPHPVIDAFRPDWRMQFFAFLALPTVASLLMMGLLIGLYMEISSPGAALPGSVAILCLMLILLSSYSQQAIGWLEVILLLAGIGLVLIEIFVLPSWGLLGFAGTLCIVAGLFALLLPSLGNVTFDVDSRTFNAAGEVFLERLAWLCVSLILSLGVIALLWRYVMPSFQPLNRLVSVGEQESSQGFYAGVDPKTLPQPGARGFAMSTLRPSGAVVIGEKRYDAVSSGDFIEEGEPIRVVRLEGSKMIVAKESAGMTH